MAAGYDQVTVEMPGGGHNLLTPAEFERISLSERIRLLCAGKLTFVKDGKVVDPRQALTDNPAPASGATS